MSTIRIVSIECISNVSVVAHLLIEGKQEVITTEVSDNVCQYITIDRCDAFVVGLLFFAMSRGYDIESQIPISEELFYNLEYHFIDTLAHEGSTLYRTRLNINTISAIKHTGNIVATGISCGVDSLYTLFLHENMALPSYKISHVAFYNVGSHKTGKGQEKDRELYEGRHGLCEAFANEYGYVFYTLTSNICDIIEKYGGYSHINNHSYMAAFCILLLQKGMNKYYYSAGYPYTDFRVSKAYKTEELDSSLYDLLLFYTISINSLKVYSAGGNIKRIDKTKALCEYPPAYKYLNVCVRSSKNDGTCFKCVRTLLSIDAVGNISDFKDVFDVGLYKRNRKKYIQEMWISASFRHDQLYQEICPYYKKELTLKVKFKALLDKMIAVLKNRI